MISNASSKTHQDPSARSQPMLVLEPPRHAFQAPFVLGVGQYYIGSDADCEIHVSSDGVSACHAIIVISTGRAIVKAIDENTWINDHPVGESTLRKGDRLSIGPITFRVRLPANDEQDAVAPRAEVPAQQESITILKGELPISSVASCPVPTPGDTANALVAADVVAPAIESDRAKIDENSITESDVFEAALSEIDLRISQLQADSQVQTENTQSDCGLIDLRRVELKEQELVQRAAALSRQEQLLHERTVQVEQRETQVSDRRAELEIENERLVEAVSLVRMELADEQARQRSLRQEWEATVQRTRGDLTCQMQSVENQRALLVSEGERLAAERLELQRQKNELDRQQRELSAEHVEVAAEFGKLQAERAAFESERQVQCKAVQEREARIADEQARLATVQDELFALRQELDHRKLELESARDEMKLRFDQPTPSAVVEIDSPNGDDHGSGEGLSASTSWFSPAVAPSSPASPWADSRPQGHSTGERADIPYFSERFHSEDAGACRTSVRKPLTEVASLEEKYTQSEFTDADSQLESTEQEATVIETDATVSAREIPMADQTLSEVNHLFGFVSPQENDRHTSFSSEHSITEQSVNQSFVGDSMIDRPYDRQRDGGVESAETSQAAHTDQRSPNRSLRNQLAQLFDLPSDSFKAKNRQSAAEESYFHSEGNSGVQPAGTETSIHDGVTDTNVESESSVEYTLADKSPVPTSESTPQPESEAALDEDCAWTRRLRELSQIAANSSATPEPAKPAASAASPASGSAHAAADVSPDENSVEAQLARLLGRPIKGALHRVEEQRSQSTVEPETSRVVDVEESVALPPIHVTDHALLAAEPKHKQNRSAVRDEVNSFRAVAQLSARTALAKHSWKNSRNEFYFSIGLTTVSVVATAWYMGTFLYGIEKDYWKGVACALATIICSHKLIRSSAHLRQSLSTQQKSALSDRGPSRSVESVE